MRAKKILEIARDAYHDDGYCEICDDIHDLIAALREAFGWVERMSIGAEFFDDMSNIIRLREFLKRYEGLNDE